MKRFIFILLVILNVYYCLPQNNNLVPNPSFEFFIDCPFSFGQIERAIPWFNGCAFAASYYNSCANSGVSPYLGVPYNSDSCNYLPAKSGNAYIGIFAELDQYYNRRTYLEVKLTEPLQANTGYYAGFWICMSDCLYLSMDMVGMYFSVDSVWCPQNQIPPVNLINAVPQVNNTPGNVLTDTANWTLISGYFKADGGEQYLVIGNFYPWNQTTWYWTQMQGFPRAYYYIDDVFVYEDSLTTSLPPDGNAGLPDICLVPNPGTNIIRVSSQSPVKEDITLIFQSMDGNTVREIFVPAEGAQEMIDITGLPAGFYLVRVQCGKGIGTTLKLIIAR